MLFYDAIAPELWWNVYLVRGGSDLCSSVFCSSLFLVVGACCRFERRSMRENFGCDFFWPWVGGVGRTVPRKIVGVTTTVQCTGKKTHSEVLLPLLSTLNTTSYYLILVRATFYKFLHHNCGGHCRMLTLMPRIITCQYARTRSIYVYSLHICTNTKHILYIQVCISVLHVYILRASAQKEVWWDVGPTFKKTFLTFLGICVWLLATIRGTTGGVPRSNVYSDPI